MEHRSRFFDRMLECSPLWYLTLFSEHASQSFWSPSPPMSARVANRMLLHFDRYFTLQSWRFEIRELYLLFRWIRGKWTRRIFFEIWFSGPSPAESHSKKNWNKVMILFQAAEVNGLTDD